MKTGKKPCEKELQMLLKELKSHIDEGKRPYPCPSVSICGEKTNCGGELPVELISIAFLFNLW